MAQWIEHRIPVPRVGGSSPFRRTKKADTQMGVCFFGISEERTRKGGLSEAKVSKCPVDTCLARGRVPPFPDASRKGCRWKWRIRSPPGDPHFGMLGRTRKAGPGTAGYTSVQQDLSSRASRASRGIYVPIGPDMSRKYVDLSTSLRSARDDRPRWKLFYKLQFGSTDVDKNSEQHPLPHPQLFLPKPVVFQ